MAEPSPKPPPTDTVRVALSGKTGGGKWLNRFWLQVTRSGSPDPADLGNVLASIAASYVARFLPRVSVACSITGSRAVWYTGTGTALEVFGAPSGSGSVSGTIENAATSFLILWPIDSLYRGGHPRTYIPGVPNTAVDDGVNVPTSTLSGMQTACVGFWNDVNALSHGSIASVKLGTLRFFNKHSALDPPVFWPYRSPVMSPIVANQRRRVRPH
jgi:hypothetical protein